MLDGSDPAMVVVPANDAAVQRALRVGEEVDDDVALVVATSGTTGAPKGALLSAAALSASASATHARLGGPGSWLLTLPPYHIAGVQVLVRSGCTGTCPSNWTSPTGLCRPITRRDKKTRPRSPIHVVGRHTAGQGTQRPRGDGRTRRIGCRADRRRPGPAADPRSRGGHRHRGCAHLRDERDRRGLRLRRWPLDGVRLSLLSDGRIVIGGATVAKGYRNPVEPDPFAEPGWFRTDDVGTVDHSGVLTVLGRVDDAISTGGLTVLPQLVEAALAPTPPSATPRCSGCPMSGWGSGWSRRSC